MNTDANLLNISEAELIKELSKGLQLESPQEQDEFTARWFAENVLHLKYNQARNRLEEWVRQGKVTVRRRVHTTWGNGDRVAKCADVYKYVKVKK